MSVQRDFALPIGIHYYSNDVTLEHYYGKIFILMILVGSSCGGCLACLRAWQILLFGSLSCSEASYEACWRGGGWKGGIFCSWKARAKKHVVGKILSWFSRSCQIYQFEPLPIVTPILNGCNGLLFFLLIL